MLKKNLILFVTLVLTVSVSFGQGKFYTKTGKVSFISKAPLEEIEGKNKTVTAVVDSKTGAVQFAIQMKGFEFEKQLMQQHFNENYVESDKFPKATFKGNIVNIASVNLAKDGTYPVKVKGMMNIHGVSKEVTADGTLSIKDGKVATGVSNFKITLKDFNIEIPSLVKDKVANDADIKVDINYEPYKAS